MIYQEIRNRKILFLTIFFLTLFLTKLTANNIQQITNSDGLSNSAILSILQDKDGYVWFGSCDGLNLYNGSSVTTFSPTNGDLNLSGNLIENLIESEDNILWIHTNYGLNKLDKKEWKLSVYPQFKGLFFIEKDDNNNIYIINDDNFIYYYNKELDSFMKAELSGIKYNDILDLKISADNKLHVFTYSGEIIFDIKNNKNLKTFKLSTETHKTSLLYCFHDKYLDIVYYIDTNNKLFEYDLITNQRNFIFDLSNDSIKKKGSISSLIKFGDNFYIGYKSNGVTKLKYTDDLIDKYKEEETGIKAGIFTLVKDRYQDLIWIGTDGNGVYMYSEDFYSIQSYTYDYLKLNISKPVRALYKDSKNDLWIGTKGDGIVKLNDFSKNSLTANKIDYFTSFNSELDGNSIYSFEKSNHNLLWIGTDDGLCYYSYSQEKIKKMNIKVQFIHGVCELNDSTLWVATVGDGVYKFNIGWNGNTPELSLIEQIKVEDGRPESNYFFTIYNDSINSKLWFGNRGYGAYYLEKNSSKLLNLNFGNLYPNQTINDVYTITKDKLNNMWFGTSLGLIQQTNDNRLNLFSQKEGLLNNTVHSILSHDDNSLWLSTNKGIARFNITQNTFHNYNNSLKVVEFSDGAAYLDPESNIMYFGGINGFITINKEHYVNKNYMPQIYFENLVIYGNKVNLNSYIKKEKGEDVLCLKYNQDFFSLAFITLDYINGYDFDYYYRLDGLSNKWINNHSSHNVSFSSLPPGNYTLQTKYINKLTGKESSVYSLKIHVSPPWYLSPLAYILYGLLIITTIFFIIRFFYVRNRRKKISLMKKIEQEHNVEVYESKLNFFTNVANEFSTPLTLIYGPCSHILSDPNIDHELKQNAELIHKNAERMNDLIQDLVEFRKVEKGYLKPIIDTISIDDFLTGICESFSDLSQSKNITITQKLQQNLKWNSDLNFLYTIITNLIANALENTPNNGNIEIEAHDNSEHLQLVVANTNKNVDLKLLNQIFDGNTVIDFFENPDQNTNFSKNSIGLLTSYNMAQLLEGTIEIKNSADTLSFIVTLPKQELVKGAKTDQTNEIIKEKKSLYKIESNIQIPDYPFDKHKLSIMVIDEDIELLWFICEIFKDNYNLLPINDYTLVSTVLDKTIPDLIIYDITEQQTKEAALIKNIKTNEKTAHIPFILISSKHSTKDRIQGIDAGIQVFISKPFDSKYIKASVKNLLSGREILKNYFDSPLSAFDLKEGQLSHKEDSKFILDIQNIIDNNITNSDLSVQIIADKMNISPRHLYRRIKEIGVDSLSDMIKQSRLHKARRYLLNSQMTINEVIYKSGFSNRATFFRLFAQKYNCTPKEYREQNLKEGFNKL